MPIGVCCECGENYYLPNVATVADHCCARCGRPLVPLETLWSDEPEAPRPPDAPPFPNETRGSPPS